MKKAFIGFIIIGLLITWTALLNSPEMVQAATIGNVNMSGDATINSDSFADTSATQYRWHSYPGSRLTLNANQVSDSKAPAGPMDNKLSIGVGGWWGTATKNFNEILRTQLATSGGSAGSGSAVATAWYPYKINYSAAFSTPAGSTVSGYDMMIDDNSTLLRVINISASAANDAVLTGKITGSGGGTWIGGTDKVILVSDSSYYYAIQIVSLTGANLTPVQLLETATISGGEWSYRKPFAGSGTLAVSIGFATAGEGSAVAISRAKSVFAQDVAVTVAAQKSYSDSILRSAPAPASWGITGINAYGVTSAQHKTMYYSSWAFVLQSLVKALPENSATYNYPQVMTGKPSLWSFGDTLSPGTDQWESLFGYQMMSFIWPETAWQSYKGLMSRVDANGVIHGESLPTRMAQTAWILYQNSSNLTYLTDIYPALKRHLLWAQDNPRWICCGHDIPEEKDFNFITSYWFDMKFAIMIATELGYSADVTLFQNEQAASVNSTIMDNQMYKDPDVIYGLFYDYTSIPKQWIVGNDMFKATGLVVNDLTTTQMNKMKSYYMSIHRPDYPMNNFAYHKYPDLSLIVEGLIDNGGHVQAQELAKAALRDTIRGKQMGEALIATGSGSSSGGVLTTSVAPSLFTPIEAIHMTWLLNNLRFDDDLITAFTFGGSSLTVPNSPDVMPTIEDFKDISDWTNTYNSYLSALGGSGIFRYEGVVPAASYGVVDKQITYNLDEFPKLTIKIKQVYGSAQWALKVNDGGVDVQLQAQTSQTGELTYNLKGITGWSGTKTFTFRLYVIGGDVKVSGISALEYVLEDFDSVSDWPGPVNATITASGGMGTVTTTTAYGNGVKAVAYNVDDNPKLKIRIHQLGAGSSWALKVNDGGVDVALEAGSSATGEFVYNLKSITGWSGTKSFSIKLFAVGGSGKYVKADYIVIPENILETFNIVSDWNLTTNASIATAAGVATITSSGSPSSVARKISVDVSRYTKLSLKVPNVGAGAQWALKVNDGSGDITLEAGSATTGDVTYNLASVTGWSGQKTFNVVLYVIGGSGKFFKADEVRISE